MGIIKWIWSNEGFYYGVINGEHRYGLRADKNFNVYGGDPLTASIIAASIIGVATVGSAVISSQGAQAAAETAAESNQAAIAAQQQAQAQQQAAAEEAAAEKTTALGEFKYPGILETPEGAKLKTTLEERMAGVGVGYSPEVLNKYTAATAAQTRAGLKEQTIPSITAAASARGLGRSTIPVSQIGSASQAAERDIEERIAQLQTASEAQKATDIQNALTQYQGLTSEQVRAKQIEAEVIKSGKFDIANTEMGAANSRLASSATVSELIATGGVTQAAYQLQQSAMVSSVITNALTQGLSYYQADKQATQEIADLLRNQENQNAARVNILPVNTPENSYRLLPATSSF